MVSNWRKVYREATRRFNAGEAAKDLADAYGVSLQQMVGLIEREQGDIHLTDDELDARAKAAWVESETRHQADVLHWRVENRVDAYVRKVRSLWHNEVVKPWRASMNAN